MRHIPGLDGCRGIAVLLVLFFHADLFPLGWTGVPIFFTLSSFLITAILREQRKAPAATFFLSFWERRARRLLPLYFGYLALITYFIIQQSAAPLSQLFGLFTFTFNYAQLYHLHPAPLWGHFWTLSIEAQFYLIWPIFIYLLKDRPLRKIALTLICLGPAARLLGTLFIDNYLSNAFGLEQPKFLLPTFQLDNFAWGALLALFQANPKTPAAETRESWLSRFWAPACATALSLTVIPFSPAYVWNGSIVSALAAALLLAAQHPITAPLLNWRWLRFTGQISYGLYIWHFGIMMWLAKQWPCAPLSLAAVGRFAVSLSASLAIALLSYYYWERHFWKRKNKAEPAPEPKLYETAPS